MVKVACAIRCSIDTLKYCASSWSRIELLRHCRRHHQRMQIRSVESTIPPRYYHSARLSRHLQYLQPLSLYHITACRVMYVVSRYIMPCHAASCDATSRHIMPHHIIWCHFISSAWRHLDFLGAGWDFGKSGFQILRLLKYENGEKHEKKANKEFVRINGFYL